MGILDHINQKKPGREDRIGGTGLGADRGEKTPRAPSPQNGGDAQEERTLDERLSVLIDKAIAVMREHAPEGSFRVAFSIPGSQNEGRFIFRLTRPGDWQLQIGASREGTDLLVSYFLCHGDREKVLAYLSKPDLKEKLMRAVKELSESVDDKF